MILKRWKIMSTLLTPYQCCILPKYFVIKINLITNDVTINKYDNCVDKCIINNTISKHHNYADKI